MGDEKRIKVRTGLGVATTRSEEELEAAEAVGDLASPDLDSREARILAEQDQRDAFDTVGDKALTFAEGVVDAASLGVLHQHGESADIRRDVNAGSALLGQLAGTAAGLGTASPVKFVAEGASKFGRAAAGMVLSEARLATGAGRIIGRGVEEAAIGAGLMGSTAVGHQVSDAIVEDKPLAGAAVLHEMGMGALMGFGAGALSGGFSVAASRSKIAAQGGLVGDGVKSLADEVVGVHKAWGEAAREYEARAGVLSQLHADGVIPEEMVVPYRDAARAARAAVDHLDSFSVRQILDASPKEYAKFRGAMEKARGAVDAADEVFRAPPSEARPQRLDIGGTPDFPLEPVRTGHAEVPGEWSRHLDELMATPEARAAYERLHGRPYEPIELPKIEGEGGIPGERFVDDAAAPTDKTAPGRRARPAEPVEPVEARTGAFDRPGRVSREVNPRGGYADRIDGGVTGMLEREGLGRTQVSGPPEGLRPWEPSAPAGRFSLDDFSPDTLAGEGQGFSPLNRQVDKGEWLNQNHRNADLGLHPDGHFSPVKDMEANARAFEEFRQKAAGETAIPEPTLVPDGPGTVKDWNVARGDGNRTIKDPNVPHGEPAVEGEATYRDPNVPRGEPPPKADRPESPTREAVTAEQPAEGRTGKYERPRPGSPEWDEFKRRAAEHYVEKWYWESQARGVRVSPADEAAARLDAALRKLSELSGGRLDSAGALELGEHMGLKPTSDPFVDRLDQIWALRKAARFAADEARGVSTPLGRGGRGMAEQMAQRYAAMKMAAIGGVMLGPIGAVGGWVVGKHLPKMLGFGAKAASASGRLMKAAAETGEQLLRGRRATVAMRAVAGNRAYAYDEEGPIQDPVQRIRKIHAVAADPDGIRARVRNQLGDAALANPAIASAVEDAAVRHMTNLSLKAPMIYFDALGRTVSPAAGPLRLFQEYENATHDVVALLGAIGKGSVTPAQLTALREQHPEVHAYVIRSVLADPEKLKKLPTASLRAIEGVIGVPLATAAPGFGGRIQASWAPPPDQQQAGGKPQAFKITAPPPTPTQASARGVAPGNE